MGGHEVVRRYVRRGGIERDLASAAILPPEFRNGHREPLLPPPPRNVPASLTPWWPEVAPDWLYFLDEEQVEVCDGLIDAIEDVLLKDGYYTVQFLIGGPGTGKTSILLQVLRRLSNQVVENAETWRIGLHVTDRVADYVTASTGWRLAESRRIAETPGEADILLIDDPASEWFINDAADAARHGRARAVIAAFDPLQLSESMSDHEYNELRERHNAGEWTLGTCYRQKQEVGEAALRVAEVVAASSPFLDDTKKHAYSDARAQLTELANTLSFSNPSGYAVSYPNATLAEWRAHLRWIGRQRTGAVRWPVVLLVVDDGITLPDTWRRELDGLHLEETALNEMQSTIKGLEYQHGVLVISAERLDAVQEGFSGSGRRLYNDYRLLRIPFTRAKDSLAVFSRG